MLSTALLFVQLAGFGIFLWLACYLGTRASLRQPLITIVIAALLAQAAFFAGNLLTATLRNAQELLISERALWWTIVLPITLWFHASDLIARPSGPISWSQPAGLTRPLTLLAYVAAVILSLVGGLTSLFISAPPASNGIASGDVQPGSAYPLLIVYAMLIGSGTCLNLLSAWIGSRRALHSLALMNQLRLLFIGSLLFLIAALWLATDYYWRLGLPNSLANVLLIAGLGGIGYGIAHYGLLLDGHDVSRDFLYSLSGIIILNLAYLIVLLFTGVTSPLALLLIVAVVTISHMTFDQGRTLLDRLFFSLDERHAREEARSYATTLGSLPVSVPLSEQPTELPNPEVLDLPSEQDDEPGSQQAIDLKTFKAHVRRALSSLKTPPRLAESPLLTMSLVEQQLQEQALSDNRLNRVTALRSILITQIEGLQPEPGMHEASTGDAWRFYNVLYYPYVRELSRKGALAEANRLRQERQRRGQPKASETEQVLAWLADIDEDTFYKWQRRASDMIASALWDDLNKG